MKIIEKEGHVHWGLKGKVAGLSWWSGTSVVRRDAPAIIYEDGTTKWIRSGKVSRNLEDGRPVLDPSPMELTRILRGL